MSEPTRERLYELLPSIYRLRDAAEGEPLRALLAVAEAEARRIEGDIAGLYDNWFIETCEDWVVPYIAELLGVRRLPAVGGPGFNQRTHVARTLSYRRRKGTHALLADLARDVAAWPVRTVEMFRLVGMTQHLDFLRPASLRTPDLRDEATLAMLNTPFDPVTRTADVRSIAEGTAVRHNLPNVAVFAWRLRSFRVERARASTHDAPLGQHRFSVLGDRLLGPSTLGDDLPLFHAPRDPGATGEEADLPGPLRPRALIDALDAIRRAKAEGVDPPLEPYFGERPAFRIFLGDSEVQPEQIAIADLSDSGLELTPLVWRSPRFEDGQTVAVDPVLGRIQFKTPPADGVIVRVTYAYGFSGEIGAGPYEAAARAAFDAALDSAVAGGGALDGALAALSTNSRRFVEIRDSESYTLADADLRGAGAVEIRAANGARPFIDLGVLGGGRRTLRLGEGPVVLDGWLLGGGPLALEVDAGTRARLTLRRCTLVPGQVPLSVAGGGELDLTLDRCITGDVAARGAALAIRDSIIDGRIEAERLSIERSTVRGEPTLGGVEVGTLELASDTLFLQAVSTRMVQNGCVRYSYFADPSSITPPRFRCQPDLALSAAADGDDAAALRARLEPRFTSERYGQPGFAQLRTDNDDQIRRGGSGGGEMGAFSSLLNLQREENLRAALDEYLRLGHEAGLFFVT